LASVSHVSAPRDAHADVTVDLDALNDDDVDDKTEHAAAAAAVADIPRVDDGDDDDVHSQPSQYSQQLHAQQRSRVDDDQSPSSALPVQPAVTPAASVVTLPQLLPVHTVSAMSTTTTTTTTTTSTTPTSTPIAITISLPTSQRRPPASIQLRTHALQQPSRADRDAAEQERLRALLDAQFVRDRLAQAERVRRLQQSVPEPVVVAAQAATHVAVAALDELDIDELAPTPASSGVAPIVANSTNAWPPVDTGSSGQSSSRKRFLRDE
jgi:hypothetical protein